MVRLRVSVVPVLGVPSPEPSRLGMSAIFSSTFRFISSNPISAASSSNVSPDSRLCPLAMSVCSRDRRLPRMP